MKTIYVEVVQTTEFIEVEEAIEVAPGHLVLQIIDPGSGTGAPIDIILTQMNGGDFEAAPIILQGVTKNLSDESDESNPDVI